MLSILKCCLIFISFTLVGGYTLYYMRSDYCELYLNASKGNDKMCQMVKNNRIITNEYELVLLGNILKLKWTYVNSTEWNTVAVAPEMRNVTSLLISGIQGPEDPRLRPASFYLNKLNLEHVYFFQINAEQFVIEENDIHYREGPLSLWFEFKQSVNLGPINEYVAASTKRIRWIDIKRRYVGDSDLCLDFQFFSMPELQEGVEGFSSNSDLTRKIKCLENYRRLKYIFYERPYKPFINRTAFICQALDVCDLIIKTNGQRCPADCKCSFKYSFLVSCRYRKLTQIPPFPIQIDGDIKLEFNNNLLSQLPNNTLPGYVDVVELDVSHNRLTSISIHQLPRKLRNLDISHNLIKTVDSRVAIFLERLDVFSENGTRWIANCDEKDLVKLLHRPSDSKYHFFEQLGGLCPQKCICCFDRPTHNFMIKCKSQKKYPKLPDRIPNKVTLLLANCAIRNLPKNLPSLLISHNITTLDLRNNKLRSLKGEIIDFVNNQNYTTIKFSVNPWTCFCEDKSFLFLLKSRHPLEYANALDRHYISQCPEGCICCLESSDSLALTVDCRGRQLTDFPLLPDTVTSLDLRNNLITDIKLQSQEFLKYGRMFKNVLLSGNPWTCTCDLFVFVKTISQHIHDFGEMECSNLGKHLALVEESEICPSYFIYPVVLVVSILMIITALNAFVYFKQPILMWFYEHEIFMSMAVRFDLECMKKYDAFLSFTHKDENLVEEYVEQLEKGERKFRLCFYLRDWQVGASIPECIIQSVKDSRRIIILLTKNFLESTWGKLEFRLALHATSKDRCKRLIVILYPDVENFDDLDSELKAYMVLNTYLRRDSPNFWNKLIYSMPHIT